MSKKIIIMLTAVIAVVSVILVSVLGQIADFTSNVLVREITILGYEDPFEGLIEYETSPTTGNKIIYMDPNDIVVGETMLQLRWTVSPDNASTPDVRFSVNPNDGTATVSAQGLVIFYSTSWSSIMITVSATDGSLVSDVIYILAPSSSEGTFIG